MYTLSTYEKQFPPFLKGKSVYTALLKGEYGPISKRDKFLNYLNTFGFEQGMKFVMNRTETVQKMIEESEQIILMKTWYDKTGGKFIPDYTVMQNFDVNEADKFLTSGANWSRLIKIDEYAEKSETKDALIKVAYSFGVFDQDQKSMRELLDLLTSIPQTIPKNTDILSKKLTRG